MFARLQLIFINNVIMMPNKNQERGTDNVDSDLGKHCNINCFFCTCLTLTQNGCLS